jgi:hypothetical protein
MLNLADPSRQLRLAQGQAPRHVQVQVFGRDRGCHPQQPEGHLQEAHPQHQARRHTVASPNQVFRW